MTMECCSPLEILMLVANDDAMALRQ